MKYAGMPFGMWALFAGSFQKQLTTWFSSRLRAKAGCSQRHNREGKQNGLDPVHSTGFRPFNFYL